MIPVETVLVHWGEVEEIGKSVFFAPFSYKLEILPKNYSPFLKGKNHVHKGMRKFCDYFCSLPHYLRVWSICRPNSPDSAPGYLVQKPRFSQ